MPTAARTRPWHARLLGPPATSVLMGTLGGFPCPPATGFVGQSPPTPTRLLVAGPVPNSLATERGRSVREFYAASESSLSRPRAELAFAKGVSVFQTIPKRECHKSLPLHGIGRRAGGRTCPDRRREELLRPSSDGCQATTESDMGGLARPKSLVRRAGHVLPPLQPSARRSRAPLSRISRSAAPSPYGFSSMAAPS